MYTAFRPDSATICPLVPRNGVVKGEKIVSACMDLMQEGRAALTCTKRDCLTGRKNYPVWDKKTPHWCRK
jgi:hypothetical protein